MNKYVYGLILACTLLSVPSVNCVEELKSDDSALARSVTNVAVSQRRTLTEEEIKGLKAGGAEKTEARKIAREKKKPLKQKQLKINKNNYLPCVHRAGSSTYLKNSKNSVYHVEFNS